MSDRISAKKSLSLKKYEVLHVEQQSIRNLKYTMNIRKIIKIIKNNHSKPRIPFQILRCRRNGSTKFMINCQTICLASFFIFKNKILPTEPKLKQGYIIEK